MASPRIYKYIDNLSDADTTVAFLTANRVPASTKGKEFQYKFLYDSHVNSYWLYKWKLEETDKCKVCKVHSDNIKHVYWDCCYTSQFWLEFTEWWNTAHPIITLSITDVFIGVNDKTLCGFIFLAKQYIYFKRCNNDPPDMRTWLPYARKIREIEMSIAKRNNTLDICLEKWQFMD